MAPWPAEGIAALPGILTLVGKQLVPGACQDGGWRTKLHGADTKQDPEG